MTTILLVSLLLAPQAPAAPTLTLRTCAMAAVATPPSSGRWKVQWFDNGVAITGTSTTYKRTLTLTPGSHGISLLWTKSGELPLTSPTVTRTCALIP